MYAVAAGVPASACDTVVANQMLVVTKRLATARASARTRATLRAGPARVHISRCLLHHRTSQIVGLNQVVDIAMDPRHGPDGWLELIAAGEEIRQARLDHREARSSASGRRV